MRERKREREGGGSREGSSYPILTGRYWQLLKDRLFVDGLNVVLINC